MDRRDFTTMAALLPLAGLFGGAWTLDAEAADGAVNSNKLSDVRVRRAIAYAIDKKTIVETLLGGQAVVADGLLPKGPDTPTDLDPYAYNPDKARALLKEAGWDSSRTLDCVYYYADQATADLMAALQAYLSDVGIKMNYRLLTGDTAAALNTVPADPVHGPSAVKWDLGYGARAALALQEYFNGLRTGQSAHTPGDAKMDALIDGINASADPAKQKTAFYAISKYENEMEHTIPLYYQQLFTYESKKVNRNGHEYGNEQYNYDWGIVDWTVEPDASGKKVMYTNTAPAEFFEIPWFNLGIWIASKVLFDRLILADGSLNPVGGELAKSYKLSDDGLSVVFELRDGAKWHDGDPVTPADVEWSIQAALKAPTVHPVVLNTMNSIEGGKDFGTGKADKVSGISISGNTITLKFSKLDPNVLLTFGQFAILPKKHFDGVDPVKLQQAPFWQKPIGSGPFKLTEVKMNNFVTMEPFADYWGGVAKIEQIVALPSGDGDANVVKNAKAGRLDYGYTKAVADVQALKQMSTMKIVPVDVPYTRMLWINQYPKA